MEDWKSKLSELENTLCAPPDNADIYWAMADIYANKLKDYERAIFYYEKYLEKDPKNAHIYNQVGYLYQKIDRYETIDKQIEFFEKSVAVKADFEGGIRNLAFAYTTVERFQDAIDCYKKLFTLNALPDDYFSYACLKICLGDFKEGWKIYEYRFKKQFGPTLYPEINKPRWQGEAILDKTLLVHYEQGFGDTIQFFRYLEQVKPLVGKIIFRVQDELLDLIKLNTKNIDVVGVSTPIEGLEFDYHIPLMSLLCVLDASINNIPQAEGYIKADEEKIEKFRKEFFDNDCLKIGISWKGAVLGNPRRNVTLSSFYPLSKLKNVKVYSFQKGGASNQLKKTPPEIDIVDLGKTFDDFSDTAAAMANVDLFITSDNSVFNLAGAMGVKTALLLNKYSEWRWFFDEKTTPWYNSVKIYKKKDEHQGWDCLMQQIIEDNFN